MSDLDPQLLIRLLAHDQTALAEFIEFRRAPLTAFIQRQLGGQLRRKVEPEDVFQEMSGEAVRSLPQADLQDRDPFGWLCQIAERKIIDLHRKHFDAQKRDAAREVPLSAPSSDERRHGLLELLVASFTTPSAAFSRNIREAHLQNALHQLPPDQREALRLRYVENLPSKEIAEKLQKSDAAIRVMLTRSLKRLQGLLEEGEK
ncbi:MAG: sigma-70 family RNA polymerase sigma factor [Pirellulaceae bacterium]